MELKDKILKVSAPIIDRLLVGKGRIFLALVLFAYSVYEVVLARRVVLSLAFPTLVVWVAVGVLPAILIAGCLRMRWMLGRKAIWGAFGGWALAVVVMATVAFTSGWLNEGRAANRIAAVTVKAIPGLKYELRRWETLDAESAVSSKPPYQVVADKVAEGASVTLSDDDPPADKAFYAIGVSVP